MPPSSPNPDPISDQKMSFFTPFFRPRFESRTEKAIFNSGDTVYWGLVVGGELSDTAKIHTHS